MNQYQQYIGFRGLQPSCLELPNQYWWQDANPCCGQCGIYILVNKQQQQRVDVNGVLTNDNTGAPSACGGTTTVTFTYTSTCGVPITSCHGKFQCGAITTNFLSCPINTTEMACQSQPAIDGAFASWLATATATGGCDGVLTK